MTRAASRENPTRIQREKTEAILAAALDVFATHGFRGATLDQIAEAAGLSKLCSTTSRPRRTCIACCWSGCSTPWFDPLRQLDPDGDPVEEIGTYIRRKLEMARDYPRESRLFAGEILQGAPHIADVLGGPL